MNENHNNHATAANTSEQLFSEAPASWNTRYLDPNGFECQITLRGENGFELLEKAAAAIAFLLKNNCLPYVYRSNAARKENNGNETQEAKNSDEKANGNGKNGNPAWCPIHECEMKRWDKDGRVWYSHKVDGAWCQGELLGLKWADLHWGSGRIYVQRQVQHVCGIGAIIEEPKTHSGKRTIQLGEGTLQALREHRVRQQMIIASAGDRWQDNGLIFPSSKGTPMDASNLRNDFYEVLAKAGVPKIRFHDLRHTAASLMLNNGNPVNVVSKIMGHSRPSITLDIYGHLYLEKQDEVARLMDKLVSPVKVELPATFTQKSQRAVS